MNDKYLLAKDEPAIRLEQGKVRDLISDMNEWLTWFNSLKYVKPITTLDKAKEFLSGTEGYHENAVVTFLIDKVGALPPSLDNLKKDWQIADCENADFSGSSVWNDLLFENGKLTVPDSVFTSIEEKHCIRAKTKEEKALIDRIEKFKTDLEYFVPKQKDELLQASGLYSYKSGVGFIINTKTFFNILNSK